MDFFDDLLNHFKAPKSDTENQAPPGVCPVCWGYQEYDRKIRTLYEDIQIDVNHHIKAYTPIRKFVKEHLDGIRLIPGEVETCPTCGNHSKNKENNRLKLEHMKRTAHAVWNGNLKEGEGKITTQSEVLKDNIYCFNSRFGTGKSTNPDELLAAAHAGCFAMALSLILGEAGYTPDSLDVTATVHMDADKLEITGSYLNLTAKIPNISQDKFMECANAAKSGCPISKALSVNITLEANLAD